MTSGRIVNIVIEGMICPGSFAVSGAGPCTMLPPSGACSLSRRHCFSASSCHRVAMLLSLLHGVAVDPVAAARSQRVIINSGARGRTGYSTAPDLAEPPAWGPHVRHFPPAPGGGASRSSLVLRCFWSRAAPPCRSSCSSSSSGAPLPVAMGPAHPCRGEHPRAGRDVASTSSAAQIQRIIAGSFAGLAGATSRSRDSSSNNLTAGRGFISLAL